MALRYETVSFLSDYGLADEFVGVTKSVVYAAAPEVRIVDITHNIRAHDVRAGGLALARAAQYLNPGVVLAVVDPGVATSRRGVAVEVGDGMSVLVGPDNGLLAPAVAMVGGAGRVFDITASSARLQAPGPTFDGRDLFGPVAGQLCAGVPIDDLGSEIDASLLMPAVVPVSAIEGDDYVAEVLWIDRFGNAQLNLGPEDLPMSGAYRLLIDDRPRPAKRVTSYSEIGSGEVGLIVDSYGMLALSVHRGSAAFDLSLSEGASVKIALREAPAQPDNPAGADTPVQLSRRDS